MHWRLEIAQDRVVGACDAGPTRSATLTDFLAAVVARAERWALPTAIPDGVRFIRRRGDAVVLVVEDEPQLRTVTWLTDDTPVPKGSGAAYRTARLAFPFVVLVLALHDGDLTGFQQLFFRTGPLRTLDDELCYPNLYNVAPVEATRQKCWLCLNALPSKVALLPWGEKVRVIRQHLWGASFNRSADRPATAGLPDGRPSYWQRMRDVDARLASLEAWEAASAADPRFPLSIAWRPTGQRIREVIDEALHAVAPLPLPADATGLSSILDPQGWRRSGAAPAIRGDHR